MFKFSKKHVQVSVSMVHCHCWLWTTTEIISLIHTVICLGSAPSSGRASLSCILLPTGEGARTVQRLQTCFTVDAASCQTARWVERSSSPKAVEPTPFIPSDQLIHREEVCRQAPGLQSRWAAYVTFLDNQLMNEERWHGRPTANFKRLSTEKAQSFQGNC